MRKGYKPGTSVASDETLRGNLVDLVTFSAAEPYAMYSPSHTHMDTLSLFLISTFFPNRKGTKRREANNCILAITLSFIL